MLFRKQAPVLRSLSRDNVLCPKREKPNHPPGRQKSSSKCSAREPSWQELKPRLFQDGYRPLCRRERHCLCHRLRSGSPVFLLFRLARRGKIKILLPQMRKKSLFSSSLIQTAGFSALSGTFKDAQRVSTREQAPKRLKNASPHFLWIWPMTPE